MTPGNRQFNVLAVLALLLPSAMAHAAVIHAVVTENGKPVENVHVRADFMGERGVSGSIIPICLTDSSGKCDLTGLAKGPYTVNAGKPEDGYPGMWIPFYRHGVPAKIIHLAKNDSETRASIVLGPQGATLEIVGIGGGGQALPSVGIILSRAAHPNDELETSLNAGSQILLPADDDVLLEVRAEGYEPWVLSSQREINEGKPLHFHAGEHYSLTIRLKAK